MKNVIKNFYFVSIVSETKNEQFHYSRPDSKI